LRGNRMAAGLVVAGMMAVPLLAAARGFALKEDYFSLVNAARDINRLAGADAAVVYHGEPNLASSLFFYLKRRVHWVGARADADFAPRRLGIGRELYLSDEAFAALWKGGRQVFLITEESLMPEWEGKLALAPTQRAPVGRSGTRVVLCNTPAAAPPTGSAAPRE
jgi:hypothetical protein